MEITTPVLPTQPTPLTSMRPGQRADRWCPSTVGRSLAIRTLPTANTIAGSGVTGGRNRHVAGHAATPTGHGMTGVYANPLFVDGRGSFASFDDKGDRLGLRAWSPPV